MAFASKKLNLDLFYNMLKAEYETSMRNIETCKEKADHLYENVQRQWESTSDLQACLFNYDKALTDLSQLADKLRKFNIQFELDTHQQIKEPKEERFTYPQPSLLEYEIGYETNCVVTHIKDAKSKLFYVSETGKSTTELVKKIQTYFHDNPQILERPPKNGEVFGLHLEGYMFRAVKENGISDKFSNFNAYLVDVGEIVEINECMPMYVLPVDCQKLPAQAVLCKLEQLNLHDVNPSEYLGTSLYVEHKFRIVDKDRSMLYVNLFADTNPFRTQAAGPNSTATNEKPVQQITNPFKRLIGHSEFLTNIAEGWTRDEAPTVVDIANQLGFPRVNDYITIMPTHIINVENFFGQLVQMESRYEPSLTELIHKMNSPEATHNYRLLNSMPAFCELVIAKYIDGFWYRARILNDMDDDAVKVFYLDYGNSRVVSINDIRQWDKRFEYLPFQAVRCKIAGIAEKRTRPLEAAEQLRKMILNTSIKARVLNNIEHLDLQMWDVYNNDVAEELISLNLVERRKMQFLRPNQILPA